MVNQATLCIYSWLGALRSINIRFQLLPIQEQFHRSYHSRPLHQLGCSSLVMGSFKRYNRYFAHNNTVRHHTFNKIEDLRAPRFDCGIHCQFAGHMYMVCWTYSFTSYRRSLTESGHYIDSKCLV